MDGIPDAHEYDVGKTFSAPKSWIGMSFLLPQQRERLMSVLQTICSCSCSLYIILWTQSEILTPQSYGAQEPSSTRTD